MKNFKRLLLIVLVSLGITGGLIAPVMWLAQPAQAAGEDGTRDTITPTNIAVTGSTVTLAASSGDGHKFTNNGRTWVQIYNTSGSTITATFITPATTGGIAIADVEVAVANNTTKIVGPFQVGLFNQPNGADRNKVYLNWSSAVTGTTANSVTLAAFAIN